MEQLKKRDEIDVKDKWDLTTFIKDEKELNEKIEQLKEINKKIISYKGKIMESSDSLYDFYQLYTSYDRISSDIYVYVCLLCDVDTTDTVKQGLKLKILKLIEEMGVSTSFVIPEMLKVPYEKVLEYIKENPNLELYRFDLEKTYRNQSHTLSEKEEELIASSSMAMTTGSKAYYNLSNADIKYSTIIDEKGNEVEVNNSNYIKFLNSKDRRVRKDAFLSVYNSWSNLKNTVSSLLSGTVKEDLFFSSIRKYNSSLEASLYEDNIDKKVYLKLIEIVHNNMDYMYKYLDIRKEMLKVDELHMYDLYVDLIDEKEEDIPFEKGKEIVFNALKPLGEKYISDLNKAFDEKWIDIYPNIGKRTGAYSWGTYDSNPYVLLNYNNTRDSVSTMAHELGHSMHSYYSIKNQEYVYYSYPIFLAEIASTVNEILLNDYLYKKATTKEEKILCLTDFLEKIKGTLYRQTMFAEFELIIHDKEQNNIPLTEEELSNTYYELNKLYFGDNIVLDDLIRYEWMRVPHFYTSFYVYKYATGISAAVSIASSILNNEENAKERYLEFLSSGCSDYPLEILKKVGVDMESGEPIKKALDMFNEKLEELKKIKDM